MADFLPKEEPEEEVEEKIALGEKEYTQDELNDLVGVAEELKQFEEKQGQSWNDVTKSWGKRGERIGELKKQVEELEKTKTEPEPEPEPGEQLTPEQQYEQIRKEAQKAGLATKDELKTIIQEVYNEQRQGEKILAKTNRVIKQAKKDGKPEVSQEELLKFMADPANPKDPQIAYNVMFEPEIDKWKEEKLMGIKKEGITTQEATTAGSKKPEPVAPNKDNLQELLSEHLKG